MKILLINPPYINLSGIKNSGGHSIPLNLAYLAAAVREKTVCEIKIIDCENSGLSYDQISERVKEFSPDIVGITFPTPAFKHVVKIAEDIKNIDGSIKIVVGGAHPTAFPLETTSIPYIDFTVFGEGEITFTELVTAISEGDDHYDGIPGIAYKQGGKVIVNEERELIEDIDGIPFPARDLFDLSSYYAAPTKKVSNFSSTSIISSRGCPYDCIHCISKLIWKKRVRYRSMESIIGEIKHCIDTYGIREFNFYDDTFTISRQRVMEFCDRICAEDLQIAWICFGRVNSIDMEMANAMKKAGCRKVSFGLESGAQEILDIMRKQSTLEMARKAVRAVNAAGMRVHASFMIGNIGETPETIRKTIDFAKSLDLDNATFFITAPFPGTGLYEIAKKHGFVSSAENWERFAPITKAQPVLVQDKISGKDLIAWQKRAFLEFYLRPGYVFKKFGRIKTFDDLKILVEGLGVFLRLQKKK
ncbi:MAG: radical SAM protein [Candidatus Omnitrophota bacterium]